MTLIVLEEAADWFDRIDELNEQERHDFAHWLAVEKNKAAFQKIATAMGQPELAARAIAMSARKEPLLKNSPVVNQNAENKIEKSRIATYWSIASAACIACMVVYFTAGNVDSTANSDKGLSALTEYETSTFNVISTSVTEEKSNVLDDGSIVYQGGDSQISVAFSAEKREVKLTKGQAYFDVTHAPQRPFIVDLDDATITVVGTAFDIDRLEDQTIVKVYDGTVRVNADREILLNRGEEITLLNGAIAESSVFTPQQLPSWRMGWLSIKDTPINEVIAKLNRYSSRHLTYIGDPDVVISGRFSLRNISESLDLLSTMQEFSVEQTSSDYIVRQVK
ncbi:FecR family protein [Alteromonas sp. BMJM2]|uniref:FecR family protein n=1 Tax=Alteromonas sp. BMJM2 TaxID=2954241 RepID=UPI0022B4843C|nr:FecR domain-containing protein [Alteromonas sp. BMJM2]